MQIRPCRPALVPLVFGQQDREHYCDLAGVSADVVASIGKQQFREKMLITHRGLSGPAILQISSYWDQRQPIAIDLAPEQEITEALARQRATRLGYSEERAARRAAESFRGKMVGASSSRPLDERGTGQLREPPASLGSMPAGTEGYEKAEVTAGGVDTDELSAKTMEARNVPGLFFIGEVVDVTGQLGGFNFQWAWASGYCAGQAV